MEKRICLVRPPALPAYQDTDIKEDPMLTSLLGYLYSINYDRKYIKIFDFQLDRSTTYDDIKLEEYDYYVIAARDLGESYRYSMRIAECLSQDTKAEIFLYGQVSPLRSKKFPERVSIVNQFEQELAEKMGIYTSGAHFAKDLAYHSYFDYINLEDWQKTRKKGAIETTRGCPYKCKFCFISVGKSYEKRWQTRPVDAIMKDLKQYVEMGITSFVFLDSEFLGANPAYHKQKKELLQRMINELPPLWYMILCRADTLQQFNDFKFLRKSGLSKVLVGVESLYQPDLDALKKDSTVPIMMESITNLIENEIECCLTFLTFHRNTTIEGLRENLKNVRTLYKHPKSRYLGVPNFSFNMEVVRDNADSLLPTDALSEVTYLKPLLESRGQNHDKACFPVEMEPLIEIYRLLQYEWVVKKCELIKFKKTAAAEDCEKIYAWFNKLGDFCLDVMEKYLHMFEEGKLSFQNLLDEKEALYQSYRDYYSMLPESCRGLSTYKSHAESIDYAQSLKMEDHGWDEVIPERVASV